jgi:transcriptional repressor NrdR
VAYLRFASVYRAFESADDFEAEIAMLRAERTATPSSLAELAASAPSG